MLAKIKETAAFIQDQISGSPEIGMILGTGLGGLVDEIDIEKSFPYNEIPNFPVSTVEGHQGKLIFGTLNGKKIIAMQGRFHYYEGYKMTEVTFPVRVMKVLGITHIIVSNACGGVNPEFNVGDIMIIRDHINFFGTNPLIGPNLSELGPRFPDMSEAYNKELIAKAEAIAKHHNFKLQKGVYLGLTGPTFETPSEYLMVRKLGGDAVGMSTVPEVIVARHMGLTVFGISVITDSGVPGKIIEASHEEVQQKAKQAEPNLRLLVKELIGEIS